MSNLISKTKVVIFKARKSGCEDFFFNGTVVEEHHQEYRYLGFVFHATNSMVDGIDHLVAAGKRQCMPCDGVAYIFTCLILPPYASCLIF